MMESRELSIGEDGERAASTKLEIVAIAAAYGLVALVSNIIALGICTLDVVGLLRRR